MPDFSTDFDILILNFCAPFTAYMHQTDTVCTGRNLYSSIHYISCICDTDTVYKEVIGIYMYACRLTTDNIQGAYNVGIYILYYV